MIKIVKCSDVSDNVIFKTFESCFSDYIIQIKIDEKMFINRFFGPEGNDRELSFIAYEGENPVGIVLGGLKTDEQIKTLRCGTMAVMPDVRGKGVAQKLLDAHTDAAKQLGCRQMFLEVIVGNDRAIGFYKKNGYKKAYDIVYRSLEIEEDCILKQIDTSLVEESSYDELKALRNTEESHMPWQSSFDFFKTLPVKCYVIKEDGIIVAGMVCSGRSIVYLYVKKESRNKGYGRALIAQAVKNTEAKGLVMSHTNSNLIKTFCDHMGMKTEDIAQYEMYKWLERV